MQTVGMSLLPTLPLTAKCCPLASTVLGFPHPVETREPSFRVVPYSHVGLEERATSEVARDPVPLLK